MDLHLRLKTKLRRVALGVILVLTLAFVVVYVMGVDGLIDRMFI